MGMSAKLAMATAAALVLGWAACAGASDADKGPTGPRPSRGSSPEPGPGGSPLPLPRDLGWDKHDYEALAKAVKQWTADPVSAYLEFKAQLNRKGSPPTPPQKEWLEEAAAQARPAAAAMITRDFQEAAESGDLRGSTIALAVSQKVQEGLLEGQKAPLETLKSHVLSAKGTPSPVWKVSRARARRIRWPIEDPSVGITLTAPKGFRFVRVTATVENVSRLSDPSYIAWYLQDSRRMMLSIGAPAKPAGRLAADELVFALTPAGDLIPCGHVAPECEALRGMIATVRSREGEHAVYFSGTFVKQGEQFDLDVYFLVPEGTNDLRLLVLGADPVAVPIGR